MLLITRTVLVSTGGRQPQKTVLEKQTDQNYTLLKIMAKTKTKKVTRGGKLYTVTSKDGGKTWTNPQLYSTPKKTKTNSSTSTPMRGKGASSEQVAKALKSDDKTIKQKLQDWWKPGSSGVETKKSSKLKITPAHDNPGAARAKKAALERKNAGLNTVTGKKKGVKKKRKITTWRDME